MTLLILSVLLSLPQIFTDGTLSFQSLNNVFGNTIIITLFLTHNIIKNKDIKLNNIYRIVFRSLIIISVIFCGIMLYTLLKTGFLSGQSLFWQISGVISGIISVIFLQYSQQKAFK
jgi:hypothetical protein|tara:strand:- start:1050 stop:1397 length:348 start_codon:yes stop_codon:yes gene_type:complete